MKDEIRVDLNDAEAVRSWAADLGVSDEELADIVRAVGNHADNIREHLLLRNDARSHQRS